MITDKQPARRTSPQRTAIIDALMSTTSHPNAAWVYERVRERFPDISLGTVYRNLELLASIGAVLELRASDGVARFDGDASEHYHLECTVCGRVMDAGGERDRAPGARTARKAIDFGDEAIEKKTGFRVSGHRLTYLGTCADCATEVGATEVGATKVGATKAGAIEVAAVKTDTTGHRSRKK